MSAQRAFEQATTAGVNFVIRGELVIASPSAKSISEKLKTALEKNRHLIRTAVFAARDAIENARAAKEQRT